MLSAGTLAPDFQLPGLAGGEVTLAGTLANGPAVLAFFKVTCPTCQLAFPYLERLAKGSLHFLAISQDDAVATRRFHDHFGIGFATALDLKTAGYPASNAYGLTNVPSLFLIEPNGKISFAAAGFAKTDFEELGRRAGIEPFTPQDNVPAWKAG